MSEWENIVKKATLKSPSFAGIFHNDGFNKKVVEKKAELLCDKLDLANIKFAAVDQGPPIYVFIEKDDEDKLEKIKDKGIVDKL